MKILFKNLTKYDKENRENFVNFHKGKYGKKELIKSLLIVICLLYIIMFNIILLNWKSLLIFIPICVLIYFIDKHVDDKRKEKNRKQKNKEYTFFFYERHIKVKYKRLFERISYFEIKKVFETNENFFLYIDDKNSLILDKNGFEIGSSKEFTEFIKKKCPFKYRKGE